MTTGRSGRWRRAALPALLVASLRLTAPPGAHPAQGAIVEEGAARSQICLPPEASAQIRGAALTLQDYVRRSSGATLPIREAPSCRDAPGPHRIWLGPSDEAAEILARHGALDDDGFVLATPDPANLVIAGPTDWGTEFGVYEFLERVLGVRWLAPGAAFTHVPPHRTLETPSLDLVSEPAFFSREFSGLNHPEQQRWARANRHHGRVRFHHNLLRLFPVEEYGKTHPEFYPVVRGRRYVPRSSADHDWQPCFSEPALVDEAVRRILRYFEEHPDATSYSLGVNDSGRYCECSRCSAAVRGRTNWLGYRDYADPYYGWANAVAARVLERVPGKTFGCLAYREVAAPPREVPVHPAVVPFMTYDRMKWVDPKIEAEGKRATALWAAKASSVGWYDYLYGAAYLVPRVYFGRMAASYRYAEEAGVRAMYAEAYPNWGEGPKLYASLKLQWDPTLDVERLLTEWYTLAFGERAAPYAAEYYRIWENFWTKTIPRTGWFRNSSQFLIFYEPAYLRSVAYGDITRSRALLERARDAAERPEHRERIRLLLRAFEYYEASAVSYLGLVARQEIPGKGRAECRALADRRPVLIRSFAGDPFLAHPMAWEEATRKFRKLKW